MPVDQDVIYSLVTKQIVEIVRELREWGISEDYIRTEINFAIDVGFLKHDEKEAAREAGH